MKNKILGSALLAIAMIAGSVSCSKEIDNGPDSRNGNQALQFSIKNGKGALVTYAIAEGDQWTINTIDVYAFSGGNLVGTGKMTEGTDYTIETSGGTSTITATPSWLTGVTGQTVSFYFVANDASSKGGAHITGTIPTSETAFKELLTNKLAGPDGDGKYGLITPVLLFSDVVADVPLTGKVQKDVELIRRDARFDIYNNMSSSIVVNKIYVSNANIQGHIFGTATGTSTPATGSHKAITGPASTDYDATTFLATSVFHLYPTTLGKAADGKTEMIIEATVGGVAHNFVLKGEMDVIANHRYILKLDPVSLTFTVTVADYEEGNGGNPVETELGGDATIAPLSNFDGSGIANYSDGVYVFSSTANTLTFDAVSTYGTQARAIHIVGDTEANGYTDLIVNKTSTITYSGISVKDSYTVNVPTATDGSYKIKLEIYSPGGEGKQFITFVMGAIDFGAETNYPYPITDPAFRKWIAENIGNGSIYLTQEEMDAVTSINISGIAEIESINGIENFQNLTELNAKDSGVTGSMDLSNNQNLVTVNINGTNLSDVILDNPNIIDFTANLCPLLSSLDLSKIPNVEGFRIGETAITEVDLSLIPNLKVVRLSGLQLTNSNVDFSTNALLEKVVASKSNIETFDFGTTIKPNLIRIELPTNDNLKTLLGLQYVPNLQELFVQDTAVEELDLTGNTELLNVRGSNCPLTLLDISKSTKITTLILSNMTGVIIKVWNGFDTAKPKNSISTYSASGSLSFEVIN